MPFQSEKQRRYLHANHPEIAKRWEKEYANGGISNHFRKKLSEGSEDSYGQLLDDWDAGLIIDALPGEDFTTYYNRIMKVENDTGTEEVESLNLLAENQDPLNLSQGVTTLFQAKNGGSYAMQGGVKNYLGDQQTVSGVPVKWQSGPDNPETELAYITKAEKDLLLKKDIHGSLKDGSNTGPEGLISLDSQGDRGTYGDTGQSYGDRQTSDTSPEVGDAPTKQDIQEYKLNREIREANQKAADDAKEATRVPTSKEIHDSILDKHAHRFKSLKDLTLDQKTRWAKDKYEDFKTAKGFMSIAAGPFGWLTAGKAVLDANKRKKETITQLKTDIKTLTDLGYPTHHHTVDTLIQSLNQEILDMTQRKDQKDTKDDGGAPIPLPVVMDEMAEATDAGTIDMFDAWGEIKRKQALRASLMQDEDQAKVGDWVGDQRLLVNSGGLANLFRVKNNQ